MKKVIFLITIKGVKKWYWFQQDFRDTLGRIYRQSFKNTSEDFKDSELILQDFIRRYTDETNALPLNPKDHRIGIFGMH